MLINEELASIIFSQANEREKYIKDNNIRLAYYTTESTLRKIIEHKEIWLRCTARMNDNSEIKYGVDALSAAFSKNNNRERFASFLTVVFDGDKDYIYPILNLLQERQYIDQLFTFIACISEHHTDPDDHEDKYGRLSMWRAYGKSSGVAMIFKSDILQFPEEYVSFTPIEYWDQDKIDKIVTKRVDYFLANKEQINEYAQRIPAYRNQLFRLFIRMFIFAIISLKHPAFREEKEWRVIHNSTISALYNF